MIKWVKLSIATENESLSWLNSNVWNTLDFSPLDAPDACYVIEKSHIEKQNKTERKN